MTTRFQKKQALIVLLMLIAVSPPAVRDSWGQAVGGGSPQWTFETIESSVSGLDAISLTIVPSGDDQIPAVAFTQGGKTLRFAARTASGETPWVNEELLTGSSFTFVRDLALVADGGGVINLVYYHDLSADTLDAGLGFLRKPRLSATWPAPTFVASENGKFGNSGQYLVSAIDPATSSPCIAYRRDWGTPVNGLFYSCYNTAAATWSAPAPTAITTAVPASGVNSFIGLAMGGSSQSHFAYTQLSGGTYNSYYVNRTSGGAYGTTASAAVAAPSAADNFYKDLFLAGGSAHLFYYDPDDGDLIYAIDNGTAMLPVLTIDSGGAASADVGQYVSAARCPNGSAHLSYYDTTNRALKYARCLDACDSASNWSASFVDPATPDPAIKRGQYSQIACDSNNVVHIAYYDASASQVKYAVPRICGNGIREGVEVCDDGNVDACTGTCNADCTAMVTITGCGDGFRCGTEQCDDGNGAAGDGCSAACQTETSGGTVDGGTAGGGTVDGGTAGGGTVDGGTAGGGTVDGGTVGDGAVCGNGTIEAGEGCDDGNTNSGDGCSPTCDPEPLPPPIGPVENPPAPKNVRGARGGGLSCTLIESKF